MTVLRFESRAGRRRFGLKGPRAAEWLAAVGMPVPAAPNTWIGAGTLRGDTGVASDAGVASDIDAPGDAAPVGDAPVPGEPLLVARLGTGEFFLEDRAGGTTLRGIEPASETHPPGVYPVLRADAAFLLSGAGALEVLAQVCNVNFAELTLEARPVVMTMMIGVAVLVLPQGAAAEPRFLIWCDPTFGEYLGESLGKVVADEGGEVIIDRDGQQGDIIQ